MSEIGFYHLLINQDGKPHSPPIGALTLTAILRQNGIDVAFEQYCNIRGSPLDPTTLADRILAGPRVVMISTMINALPLLILALRIVRAASPDKIIVAGGPGFGGIGSSVIETLQEIDVVSAGEGERVILPLAEALLTNGDLSTVPGIYFRRNGQIIDTGLAGRVADLDTLTLPDYAGISIDHYHNIEIMAARGCPLKCAFCDVSPAWGRRNTRRSIDHVLDEMEELQDRYGITEIGFADDLFTLNRKWVRAFCERKRERGINMVWRANGHINLVDRTLAENMAAAGCRSIFFGIEAGSNSLLNAIEKNFTIEKAFEVLGACQDHMEVSTNFMWGFPQESFSDFQDTLNAYREVLAMDCQSSLVMLAPLRQSPLYAHPMERMFSRAVPNIFCKDYALLESAFEKDFHELVARSPDIFGAFYHFNLPDLAYRTRAVELERILCRTRSQFDAHQELWQRV